jgi:hypothetical protein
VQEGLRPSANLPIHLCERVEWGLTVRVYPEERQRLFLTFAAGDLVRVREFAVELRECGGGIAVDYSLPSQPFAAQRAEIIRASLVLRIQHCAATVCLLGAETLENDWVMWTLGAARSLGRPIIGAPLAARPPAEAARRLAAFGADVVPLTGAAIVSHLQPRHEAPPQGPAAAGVLDHVLRLMMHRAR